MHLYWPLQEIQRWGKKQAETSSYLLRVTGVGGCTLLLHL